MRDPLRDFRTGYFRRAVAVMLALGIFGTPKISEAAIDVTRLRVEMQDQPLNVNTASPRFSWILESDERGQRQRAWHLLAATRTELLQPGKADLWDSGRRDGEASIHLPYEGKPLGSNQTVYWTVRSWDKDEEASDWAKPAMFRTAILHQGDWKAKWIGAELQDSLVQVPVERANWIWGGSETTGTGVPRVPAGELRLFRKVVQLEKHVVPTTTILSLAADNEARIWVNGSPIGQVNDWEQVRQFNVSAHIREGRNVFLIAAKNAGSGENPAALLALISKFRTGMEDRHLGTDGTWSVTVPTDGDELNESAILRLDPICSSNSNPARVLGPWGMKPWANAVLTADVGPRPIFHKEFTASRKPVRAVVHISGLGHHKLFVNGQEASNTFLDPAWAKYEKTVFYSTYDITSLLQAGSNAFGVMLANGFYNTAGDRRVNHNHDKRQLTLIAQAHLEYEDGTSETVITDNSWKWREGPYLHTSILGGVDYDARQLPDNWSSAGATAEGWMQASELTPDHEGQLVAAIAPPMRTFEEFRPVSIEEPEAGVYLYDFGQNASATPRLKVKGPAGATLRLTYSEQRHGSTPSKNDGKGRADQSGIRSPNYLEYTLRGGGEEEWFPHLFYSGYQYIELTEAVPQGQPNPRNLPVVTGLTSVHVRTDCPPVGTFACSDPMYERIDRMVDWSVRSNLAHVLTDCPHREKMGWLEVIHLMWPSIASRYDLALFGRKVAKDIRDSQGPDGIIYTTAPDYATFNGAFQYTPEWGASGVLVPWYTYLWYADERVLAENYDCMRDFVDYMHRTAKDLVPIAGLGDWYDYGHGEDLGASRFTPTELTAMATFGDCARVVGKAAAVLGKNADAQKYTRLAEEIAVAFNRHWEESPGEYKNHGSPQTANAIALVTGQVPADQQKAKVDAIVADMEEREWLQTAGDVGFHYLVRALADWGRSDAIFNMLAREELGSYQYLVNAGWTSLPESWNAYRSYSMNHCMLGHIQEWFSQDLGGIKPDPAEPGFRRFFLVPTTDGPVTSASATLQTPYGEITCRWEKKESSLSMQASVPVGTEALLRLPQTEGSRVSEGGKPLGQATGIQQEDGKISGFLRLQPGRYSFLAE